MVRNLSAAIGFIGIAMFAMAQPALPTEKPVARKSEGLSTSAQLRLVMDLEVGVPAEFRGQPVGFSKIIRHLVDYAQNQGKVLPVWIDEAAFKSGDPLSPSIADAQVQLPPLIQTMTIRGMLRVAGSQVSPNTVAIPLVADGRVQIVPREFVTIKRLLDQPVALNIRQLPLTAAVQELTDKTGLTIQIDPRGLAGEDRSITLRTENDTTVRGVLMSWADMFDLKLIEDADRVLLMPRVEYMKKLRAEAEEVKLNSEIRAAKAPVAASPRIEGPPRSTPSP